jgi:hypothetical protein
VVVTVGGNIGRQTNMYMLPGSAVGAALHAINKGLANARAAHAIRFHILNPGPTRTERLIGYAQMLAKQSGISVEQVEQQLVKDAPQHRIAEPEYMAAMILWMLSARFAAATSNSVTACGASDLSRSICAEKHIDGTLGRLSDLEWCGRRTCEAEVNGCRQFRLYQRNQMRRCDHKNSRPDSANVAGALQERGDVVDTALAAVQLIVLTDVRAAGLAHHHAVHGNRIG